MHNATDVLNIAVSLIEAARVGELACSAPFLLAPWVSRKFGEGEAPSVIAGLLAGAGFLKETHTEFVLGERSLADLSASTLLEGWTLSLCPPSLAAAAYVVAGLHPLYGLDARKRADTEVSGCIRAYATAIAAGTDIRVASCDFRDEVGASEQALPIPALGRLGGEISFRMFEQEPALPIVRALYDEAFAEAA